MWSFFYKKLFSFRQYSGSSLVFIEVSSAPMFSMFLGLFVERNSSVNSLGCGGSRPNQRLEMPCFHVICWIGNSFASIGIAGPFTEEWIFTFFLKFIRECLRYVHFRPKKGLRLFLTIRAKGGKYYDETKSGSDIFFSKTIFITLQKCGIELVALAYRQWYLKNSKHALN